MPIGLGIFIVKRLWRHACAELISQRKFAPKMFADGPEYIEVSGTLSGEGIWYPNNTYVINCDKAARECQATAVNADKNDFACDKAGALPDRFMDRDRSRRTRRAHFNPVL